MCDSEMLIFLRSQSVHIDCIIVVQVMCFLMVYACMFVSANVDSKLICSSFINGEGKYYCLSRFTNSFNLLPF